MKVCKKNFPREKEARSHEDMVLSVKRRKLRLNQDFQLYQAYHCGHWFGQLQGGHPLSGYSNACLEDGNGDSFLSACEVLEHSSEPSIVSKGTTALAENQDEDSLEDPNAHFNTETLNKEFMVRSEELYDSLMNCHWQPLDTVHCKIPEKTSK